MGQGRNARRARLPLTRIPHSEKLLGVLALTGAPKLFGQSQVEVEPVRRYRTIAAGALGNGSSCVLLERSESDIWRFWCLTLTSFKVMMFLELTRLNAFLCAADLTDAARRVRVTGWNMVV